MARSLANPILLALFLSASLAIGFIPTTAYLAKSISDPFLQKWLQTLLLPVLSSLFYFSGPLKGTRRLSVPKGVECNLSSGYFLPWLIALTSGFFINQAPITFLSPQKLVWYLLAVPIGEELLFRGWVFRIYETFYREKSLTATNPLPITLWMSALCFSLWHIQNISVDGLSFVSFQVMYTFFVGLWLGRLRWLSGGLTAPILGHSFLNIFGSLLYSARL